MIRTVWLAAICLAAIAGLCASRVAASISPPDESVPAQTTADAFVSSEALAKADKLEVVRNLPAVETASSLPSEPPVIPEITPKPDESVLPPPANPKESRRTVMLPKPRPKIRLSKTSNTKTVVDVKNCSRPDDLVGLLASLSGSIDCS
jgi:outer membrane biosynthesis protein TonB